MEHEVRNVRMRNRVGVSLLDSKYKEMPLSGSLTFTRENGYNKRRMIIRVLTRIGEDYGRTLQPPRSGAQVAEGLGR